jgi:hypothetical protein
MTKQYCIDNKIEIEVWDSGDIETRVPLYFHGQFAITLHGERPEVWLHYRLPADKPEPKIITDRIELMGTVQKMQRAGRLFLVRYDNGVWRVPQYNSFNGHISLYEWLALDEETLQSTGEPQKFTRGMV